jgi:adenylate kinase family enzyme
MKIAILGYSGSGKSTLARQLSNYYKIPLLFLDTVQFLPNWVEREKNKGRSIVWEFMQNESWVIDGNYNDFYQKERLEQADKIVFLGFSRTVCLYRAFKRYFQYKNTTRESMASGCIEKMDIEFIWWILHKGRTKKRRDHYKQITSFFEDKTLILNNQKQVDEYIKQIQESLNLICLDRR